MSGKLGSGRVFSFYIDRGGTFTDVYAEVSGSDGNTRVVSSKLLSEDPKNYPDAPREGIRRVLEQETGEPHPRNKRLDSSRIKNIRMGTTVATNALLERKGDRFGLLVTKGMKDLWKIGNQARPEIFDLKIDRPDVLYEKVIEIDERVLLSASVNANGREVFNTSSKTDAEKNGIQASITGEEIKVEKRPEETEIRQALNSLYEKGIRSLAVVFMHAAVFPNHERIVGDIAREIGFSQISLSHEVMKMVKIVPRGYTTCVDAYLTPHITRYLDTFVQGFDENLLRDVNLSFMQSDGGLASISRFSGHGAILSGPAGGVVGYAVTAYGGQVEAGLNDPRSVIGFDMGGTSTDVSRYAGGPYEHVYECTIAGVTIQAPQLDINTVAAGGGSRLCYKNGMLNVGPESVGAHPGPVCYRKGGINLAVTDANLMLGRIIPEFFPKIFGENENEPLDADATKHQFRIVTEEINKDLAATERKSPEQVALGFLDVANEAMCRPIRELTQMRGYDITSHILASFGGAGGQHACAIARKLGMKTVFVHRYSGILSAYGIGLADVVEERQEPTAHVLFRDSAILKDTIVYLQTALVRLEADAKSALLKIGIEAQRIKTVKYLNLRFQGTDTSVMTEVKGDVSKEVVDKFIQNYKREFGFTFPDRDILVDDVRVRLLGSQASSASNESKINIFSQDFKKLENGVQAVYKGDVFFEQGWIESPAYQLNDIIKAILNAGNADYRYEIMGPAIILDTISTILVEPHCKAMINADGDVLIEILQTPSENVTSEKCSLEATKADPIQLAIFSHRFMSIAEQMGRTLQRTSVSVNIKERLDFSCALFSPSGGLVANAPHIPVHLGAMQDAVRFQMKHWDGNINPGDVFVSNHPQLAGGSHLPDITVITPVFHDQNIVFWVASRGHHADIGGISPGSMPPKSTRLVEEGAAIVAFKLVESGVFQHEGIVSLLTTPAADEEGIVGTRCIEDNISDLKAQVAANNKGILLVQKLIEEHSLSIVHAYMEYIQANAETAVRTMLKKFALQYDLEPSNDHFSVEAEDFMDNGSRIKLKVTINKSNGDARFDFSGTGSEVFGNINAPPSITKSAIVYSLRSMLAQDIPLNEGCLVPVELYIEPNSLLSPSPTAGVVGGNVLTSQRVVDVILKAFKACAASQGDMNNLTFGDGKFGYYETIAGGAGAGPDWHGRSGVHTHMTNTRITDPEVLERRYPVILRQFSLRPDSGGKGKFNGGDGVIREIEFLRPLTVSILSERRVLAPYGLYGGESGKTGLNEIIRRSKDGAPILVQNLGGKNSAYVYAGDSIKIFTPGGGGYGSLSTSSA